MRTTGWILCVMSVACGAASDGGADTDDTGAADTGSPGPVQPVDTGSRDTADGSDSDTDTGGAGPPGVQLLTDDWSGDWMQAITVDPSANAGVGEVRFDVTTDGGSAVALYLAGVSQQPRQQEEHTLTGAPSPEAGVKAWTRSLRCDASATVENQRTVFPCYASEDAFSDGADDQQVAVAIAVWGGLDVPGLDAPSDCIRFGRFPDLLVDDPPPVGLTPPSWVTTDCRAIGD